jgi:UDP-sulfoquinovose synthase
VLSAIVDCGINIHLVHLGTMGVYGYSGELPIPEGYQRARLFAADGSWQECEILAPTDPGSIYHATKAIDQLLFAFYNKNDRVRVSDLHQGVVWGTNTEETQLDERLINRFDYDGDFGMVLNRFIVQAAVGHPLIVYGTGGQTRAFIHIRDPVECIRLAVESPPPSQQRVRILNQMTETHRVRDLARLIAQLTGASISPIANPRSEAEENSLEVVSVGLREMGLQPTTLAAALLNEIFDVARRYASRIDAQKILPRVTWSKAREVASSDSACLG